MKTAELIETNFVTILKCIQDGELKNCMIKSPKLVKASILNNILCLWMHHLNIFLTSSFASIKITTRIAEFSQKC